MSWFSVIADEYLSVMEVEWVKLTAARKPVSFELRLKKPWDGFDSITREKIYGGTYILAAASPQEINGNTYISGCITDISRQKWAEGQQRRQRDEALDMKRQQEK